MLEKVLLRAQLLFKGEGRKGRIQCRTRTARLSCSTVVGHVIVNQETRVQTRLDHQCGTRNDIMLGVHKKIFASAQTLSAMSQRC